MPEGSGFRSKIQAIEVSYTRERCAIDRLLSWNTQICTVSDFNLRLRVCSKCREMRRSWSQGCRVRWLDGWKWARGPDLKKPLFDIYTYNHVHVMNMESEPCRLGINRYRIPGYAEDVKAPLLSSVKEQLSHKEFRGLEQILYFSSQQIVRHDLPDHAQSTSCCGQRVCLPACQSVFLFLRKREGECQIQSIFSITMKWAVQTPVHCQCSKC